MRKGIAIIRLVALALFIFLYFSGFLLCLLIVRIAGLSFEKLRNRGMRFWSAGVCKIFNLRVIAVGSAPKTPFILVLNHLSYLDIIPIFLHTICTFVAKKEVRSWPVLGFMVKTMGVIFVDRGCQKDVVRVQIQRRGSLTQLQGLTLFPQGTPSDGPAVLPFRSPMLDFRYSA